jgi:hypothetical protein
MALRATPCVERSARVGLTLALLLPMLATGCGSDKPTPTSPTPSTTPSVPIPSVTSVSITGNLALTAIGETSQLQGIAKLSDGSTKDVTSAGTWQGGDPRVMTISPAGLVSVTGFGATWIIFVYQQKGTSQHATATLPGTYVIAGRVREPGASGVPNAEVLDTLSGRSATTDADGLFSLAGLPQPRAHFKFEKEGYESAEVEATEANVDLPVQRVLRLTAGGKLTAQLAPNDLSYTVAGGLCSPCRLFRVGVLQPGTLHVRATWSPNTASRLALFGEGSPVDGAGELTVDRIITAPREVLLYLGAFSTNIVKQHTAFTIETSMQ